MNLLELINNGVYETSYIRKLTINGVTKDYKVYKIDPDLLFFNESNDRIATWINEYKSTGGKDLSQLDKDEYNLVIEKFVYDSNPQALEKTKKNIQLVNQREPGVVLPDGRVIDGNRRFTCIRMINRTSNEKTFFEAAILPLQIESDYKAIKLLELSIQHGEEQRVGYNSIDRLLGMYFDLVINKTLTIDEYSLSTNEPVPDIKRHLVVASYVDNYLAFIHAPQKFYLARDMQIVSSMSDLADFLRRIKVVETQQLLKEIVFSTIFLNATGDFRKYIRDLSMVLTSGAITVFLNEQSRLTDELKEELEGIVFNNTNEIRTFVEEHVDLASEFAKGFDFWLNKSRKKTILAKPVASAVKAKESIDAIDSKVLLLMNEEEKAKLARQLHQVVDASGKYLDMLEVKEQQTDDKEPVKEEKKEDNSIKTALPDFDEPVFIVDNSKTITSLICSFNIRAIYRGANYSYKAFFRNSDNQIISDSVVINIDGEFNDAVMFNFSKSPNQKEIVYLNLVKVGNPDNEISFVAAFKTDIAFSSDFLF